MFGRDGPIQPEKVEALRDLQWLSPIGVVQQAALGFGWSAILLIDNSINLLGRGVGIGGFGGATALSRR